MKMKTTPNLEEESCRGSSLGAAEGETWTWTFQSFLAKVQLYYTEQKLKFSIKNFFSKCDQIRRNLRIWSHLLKKSLMENFIFCAVLGLIMAFITI